MGQGPDEYLPQQSIRTLTNVSAPHRHHLKLPLSILNTLVWRGLPTERTLAAPRVTEFLGGGPPAQAGRRAARQRQPGRDRLGFAEGYAWALARPLFALGAGIPAPDLAAGNVLLAFADGKLAEVAVRAPGPRRRRRGGGPAGRRGTWRCWWPGWPSGGHPRLVRRRVTCCLNYTVAGQPCATCPCSRPRRPAGACSPPHRVCPVHDQAEVEVSASVLYMSMSLDGYIAGPNDQPGNPGGDGFDRLHEWGTSTDGENVRPSGPAAQLIDEMNATGAVLAGRRTAEQVDHWGGDHHGVPIFVPSHRPPGPSAASYPLVTYVTDGIASAMARAKAAAGDRNVMVHGAYTAQRALEAGVLDELEIHQIPVLFGGGRRLFEVLASRVELEIVRVIDTPEATHLHYRVRR
jgi:dihydrofolate reductase